jgi:uncharacterized protein (TIRG00374 family)
MHGVVREEETKTAPGPRKGRPGFGEDAPSFFTDPKKLIQTGAIVVVLIVAIYVLFPKVVGLEGSLEQIKDGDPRWIAAALGFNLLAFGAYVALFRAVVGEEIVHLEWRESYQITMAGLAATRLFSAGGAGGLVLTYWALRKAGMERRQSARRMVAFLVMLYAVYMLALVIFGVLLRTDVLSGEAPVGLTIVPAGIAGGLIILVGLLTLLPQGFERKIGSQSEKANFWGRTARRLAAVPATLAEATRTAASFMAHPLSGGLALTGAIGFWAANIGILWASFHAFGVEVPLGVLVQGFFVGMVANLIPLPGGVGGVDAGMIGAFVLFGLPGSEVFTAVLCYRVIAFWIPIPPGVVAFFQLQRTVHRWEQEGREVNDPPASRAASAAPA